MYLQATTTYGSLIPGSEFIRSLVRQGTMSPDAPKRLRWMDHYARSENARQTCRYFGIAAQTFYRWKNRIDPYDLTTLEEESRRPRRVRQAETHRRLAGLPPSRGPKPDFGGIGPRCPEYQDPQDNGETPLRPIPQHRGIL